jgi:hypothetical protein
VEGVSKAVSLKRKFADQYVHEVLTRQVSYIEMVQPGSFLSFR